MENYGIGQIITDLDGSTCTIVDMTSNSICVHIKKKKEGGIDCNNWFTFTDFEKRFKAAKLKW
jgi:hypothetical protein